MEKRKWSDLPTDLLSPIADRLGLIELLGFRGVCKDWKSASSTASAKIQCKPNHEPWFLIYGETSECILLSNSGKKYTIEIPELNGATCLASYQGWLLMFKEGSMFFFCPFSHAKVDLPKLPYTEVTDHVAAFSSPPTSQDCVVAVINHSNEGELELNLLLRGANTWTNHKTDHPSQVNLKTIRSASFHDGVFNFCDSLTGLVTFSVEDQSWKLFQIISYSKENLSDSKGLPFSRKMSYFRNKDLKKQLGLSQDVSISTCGTTLVHADGLDRVVFNERIIEAADDDDEEESQTHHHIKGVWIQPRLFEIPPNHSW